LDVRKRYGLPALAAATAAPSAAATTTIATAAPSATTAATTIALRTSFIDGDRATIQLRAVQGFDRGAGLVIVLHRYKSETARAASVAIRDYGHFFDLTVSPKLGLQRFLRRREGKVANIQLHRAKLQNKNRFQITDAGNKTRRPPEQLDLNLGCNYFRDRFGILQGHQTTSGKRQSDG
jgi:hypothetical protein